MHGRLPNRCHKATATLRLLLTFHTTVYARKASPMPSGGDCKGSGPLRVQSAAGRSVRTRHSAQQVTMRRATASSARAAGSRADAPERASLGVSANSQLLQMADSIDASTYTHVCTSAPLIGTRSYDRTFGSQQRFTCRGISAHMCCAHVAQGSLAELQRRRAHVWHEAYRGVAFSHRGEVPECGTRRMCESS